MEILIATIITAVTVTVGIVVALGSETTRPVGTRERMDSQVEHCIYDHADGSLDCILADMEE